MANGLDYWGVILLEQPDRFLNDPSVRNQLAYQATIWHDLLLFLLGLVAPALSKFYRANPRATTIVTSNGSGLAFLLASLPLFPSFAISVNG